MSVSTGRPRPGPGAPLTAERESYGRFQRTSQRLDAATAPFASAGKGVHRGTTRVCAWIQGRCRSRTLAGPATFG